MWNLNLLSILKDVDRNTEVWIRTDDEDVVNGQLCGRDGWALLAGNGVARGYTVGWLINELMQLPPEEQIGIMDRDTGNYNFVSAVHEEDVVMAVGCRGYKEGETVHLLTLSDM